VAVGGILTLLVLLSGWFIKDVIHVGGTPQQGTATVYLRLTASSSQALAVQDKLSRLPYTSGCHYRTPLEGYDQAEKLLEPAESSGLTVRSTPAAFLCTLNRLQDGKYMLAAFSKQPGVLTVSVPVREIRSS
jgi:cell division protein FtsX